MPDNPPTNPSVDLWFDHSQFTGIDSEIAAKENLVYEQAWNSINIPWLLSLSVSQGNAMTSAIARNSQFFTDSEEGGGGGNESGAQTFGGAQSGGLSVSW